MSNLPRLLPLAALALSVSCGSPDFKSSNSFDNGNAGASSTAVSTSEVASNLGESSDAQANCPGVAPHGDHRVCDEGDKQVADGTVPTAAAPAAETAPASEPAPAAAPAPAPAPSAATATTAETSTTVATATSTGAATDPNLVEFHITAGTGTKGYNTAATVVTAKVGQTLRLYNDDTIGHRLHTGGAPCPHQPNVTAPGAFFDCVLTTAIDTTTGDPVYDHISGPTSTFFLKVTK